MYLKLSDDEDPLDNEYYSFLNVSRTATQEEITAAYKKLSRLGTYGVFTYHWICNTKYILQQFSCYQQALVWLITRFIVEKHNLCSMYRKTIVAL